MEDLKRVESNINIKMTTKAEMAEMKAEMAKIDEIIEQLSLLRNKYLEFLSLFCVIVY